LRGEGRGEGLFPRGPSPRRRPLTRRASRVDLSPQAGRGKDRAICDSPAPQGGREHASNRGRGIALASLALALLLPLTPALAAGDVAAGRQKALACQTCHGLDGLSKLPEAPHLAGQPEAYLVKALNDYREGARKNEMMSVIAPALSDQDVADLAAYFAAIEIETKPSPR
jgi:cytochrome c553